MSRYMAPEVLDNRPCSVSDAGMPRVSDRWLLFASISWWKWQANCGRFHNSDSWSRLLLNDPVVVNNWRLDFGLSDLDFVHHCKYAPRQSKPCHSCCVFCVFDFQPFGSPNVFSKVWAIGVVAFEFISGVGGLKVGQRWSSWPQLREGWNMKLHCGIAFCVGKCWISCILEEIFPAMWFFNSPQWAVEPIVTKMKPCRNTRLELKNLSTF